MWGLFVFDATFFVFVLYAMGYPLCCIFSRLDNMRLSVAPLLELAVIFALANLYVLLDVKVSWIGIVASLAIASAIALVWCSLRNRDSAKRRLKPRLAVQGAGTVEELRVWLWRIKLRPGTFLLLTRRLRA